MIGQGMRHFDLHFSDNGAIMVFFSMVGDRPERILLGTIDTTPTDDWNDWRLLPGPRVSSPEHSHGRGNAPSAASEEGPAPSEGRHVRDPRFLPDPRPDPSPRRVISGWLFYTVQGERGVAADRIRIDLDSYRDATRYRDHANILPEVLNSTSLARDSDDGSKTTTNLLVTGVGRSGTTSICTLFQKLGIEVSHDNDVDCGPYPGSDGAVSWYDAFKSDVRRYRHVVHLVRDPLRTINSRIAKCRFHRAHMNSLRKRVGRYEKISGGDGCTLFSIKHWVRRNSFVEYHASWREKVEILSSEPLSVWEMCMAASFGRRCPGLPTISFHLEAMPSNLNSLYRGATLSKKQRIQHFGNLSDAASLETWRTLEDAIGEKNRKYVQIAQDMAKSYGYPVPQNHTIFGYHCMFTKRVGNSNKFWDCFVKDDRRPR